MLPDPCAPLSRRWPRSHLVSVRVAPWRCRQVESSGGRRPRTNETAFLVDFLPVIRRSLSRSGFTVDHVQYYADVRALIPAASRWPGSCRAAIPVQSPGSGRCTPRPATTWKCRIARVATGDQRAHGRGNGRGRQEIGVGRTDRPVSDRDCEPCWFDRRGIVFVRSQKAPSDRSISVAVTDATNRLAEVRSGRTVLAKKSATATLPS